MLSNPAFVVQAGTRPVVSSALPSIGSDVWALDTSYPLETSFFTDTGGTVPVSASGQAVARAANLAGGSAYFAQAIAAARPSLVFGQVAGLPALRFAGADGAGVMDHMTVQGGGTTPGDLFKSRSFTLLLVYRQTALGGYQGIFAAGNGSGGGPGQSGAGFDSLLVEAAGGRPRVRRAGAGTAGQAAAPEFNPAAGRLMKLSVRASDAAGIEMALSYTDGYATAKGPAPLDADAYPWNTVLLGAELAANGLPTPNSPALMDLFEFRFWGARATDDQYTQLQGYAGLKWG